MVDRHYPSNSFGVIKVPPNPKLGKAMYKLTEHQRSFVIAMLDYPDLSLARAAAAAGYTGDELTLKATGWRLSHEDKIQEAMLEEAKKRVGATTILAVSKLAEIVSDDSNRKLQLRAIEMVLNRTGLHAISEHTMKIEDNRNPNDAETLARIANACKMLKVDPKVFLGQATRLAIAQEATIMDAEYVEVPAGADGLDDIL